MGWEALQWGELFTLLMIGTALGMDAFSLGIGMGMRGIRLLTIAKVSLTIGLFHIVMPLIGIGLGLFLTAYVGNIASYIGGFILVALGLHMLWDSLFSVDARGPLLKTTFWGLLLFSFSVSLDALSVGFSFGLFKVNTMLAVLIFGVLGAVLAALGLLLGRRVGGWLGEYSEIFGAVILLGFGIKFLL